MQLKYFFASALLAAANAQSSSSSSAAPSSSSAIPASISKADKIILSALPSSALAFLSKHGGPALFSHFASEEAAGATPGFLTKLPPALSSRVQHDITVIESVLGLVSSSSSSSVPASMSSSSSALLTPATTTGTSASASASSSSSNNYAAKPTAVITAGVLGAVGVIGILAL